MLPAAVNVGQPISHRLDHMLSGVRAQIALKIFGEDLDTLRSLAEQMQTRMAGIRGLVDLQVERQVRIPQVQISVDYQKAAHYGVAPSHVTEALETLLKGIRPAELPVQQVVKIEMVVNLKTAKTLGITFPLPLIGRADEVIE